MVSVVKQTLEIFPVSRLSPGDAIITNDPYISGSHLPDICMISPLFIQNRCVGLLANLAHHVDIGGMAPGGMPTISTEIFQEGLRIPPIRLRKAGRVDEEIMALINTNVRTSYESYGDFQAQMAANNVGERRLRDLFDKYGYEQTTFYMEEMINYSERRMRAGIAKLPEGTYEFEDYLEGDGITDDRLTIKVSLTIDGNRIIVDFTGTSNQTKGSVNCTRAVTLACVYYALKSAIDPELPSSEGVCRPVEVITPSGSLVNPRFPAPVSNANINTSQRIAETVLGALAQFAPERVPAASYGTMSLFTVGGVDPRTNQYYSYVETYGGGHGALFNQDGLDGTHAHMTNTRNTPTEVIEIAYPLRVEKYGLVKDTDGPGRYRGGLGLTRELTILDHQASITIGSERREIAPWGLKGGRSGGCSDLWIETPTEKKESLPSKVTRPVDAGTRVVLKTAGGGGYGNPFERDLDAVCRDVQERFISIEKARSGYGVVINPETGKLDQTATEAARENRQ